MKSFNLVRKSGYNVASFRIDTVKVNNFCGCGKLIKRGELKVVISAGDSYPTPMCKKCTTRLIKVLQQVLA